VVVIANLAVAGWIEGVRTVTWHFGEHLCEEHVKAGIVFDEVFELLEDWVEGFWVGVYVVDLT
jgi:hypothetical protein